MIEENNISPIRSDFEQIKKQNESGSEYWTSRDLCVALCYSTYQKFTRTISKAIAIANHKGLNTAEYFNHTVEMVRLVFGSFRNVENIHLSSIVDLSTVNVRTITTILDRFTNQESILKEATIRKIGIVQSKVERDTERTPLLYNWDAIR